MSLSEIHELEGLNYLEDLAEEYENKSGSAPFNLSHWDPSKHTINALLKYLRLPPPPLAVPYIYSYYTGVQEQIIQRLGFSAATRDCLLVHSGTSAMVLAVRWLKALGLHRVVILCPAYFPVFYASEIMDLSYERLYMHRDQGKWHLPREEIVARVHESPSKTAVWITNPVYCTGVYLSEADRDYLHSLLDTGVAIVADECLAKTGYELGRLLGRSERFLGLYSPHKTVCLNAVKFAAMIFDTKYEGFFDSWVDVLTGGLGASNYSALIHFLDDNFSHFQSAFFEHTDKVRKNVLGMINSWGELIEGDEDTLGHFITCYAPKIHGDKGNDKQFLRQLISNTGAIVIPGIRNHFDPDMGFNFRINLARGCPQFYPSLYRTIEYLAGVSSNSPN
jgi:aspartate/methionine/tyrosine aminotransferase